MIITTRYVEEEVFEAENDSGAATRYDMRSKDLKKNLSPVESLLGALASCIGVDVIDILKKRRKTVSGLTMVTDGDRRTEHPKYIKGIKCKLILESADANLEEFTKAGELVLAKYCSVASTIKPEVELQFEIIRPE